MFPLDGKADFGVVHGFANTVGTVLVSRDPKRLTQEFSKADRGGRILVDTDATATARRSPRLRRPRQAGGPYLCSMHLG